MRRLNRSEYRNTVRDLLLVDYAPTEDFPSDDVGYGFDNIGDVLTLPPLLMERYLAAAEAIAAQAIVDDNPPKPRVKNLFIPKDASPALDRVKRNGLRLASEGAIGLDAELPSDGDYLLSVQAIAEQAGDEPARMAFRVDQNEIHRVDVTATKEFKGYQAKFHADRGKHRFEVAFVNDYFDPSKPEGQRDRNLIVRNNFWELTGPLPVDKGRLPESHKQIVFKKPKGYGDVEAIARHPRTPRLARLSPPRDGRRGDAALAKARRIGQARRRPDRGRPPPRRAEAVLVSPHFLFRVELDRNADGVTRRR